MTLTIGRRELLAALGGAAACPLAARAQQAAMPLVGFLSPASPEVYVARLDAFREGLRDIGFVEGHSVAIEYRWAHNRYERLPELAAELVGRNVTVIVAAGSTSAALAAKRATQTIPVVFNIGADPVEVGLVASLARPGGNVTGLSQVYFTLTAKRLEMLHELVGRPLPIALLVNPINPYTEQETRVVQATAKALGLRLHVLNATGERDLTAAFRSMVELQAGALLVGADPVFTNLRDRVIALAAHHGVPAIYAYREFTADGGLISYGINIAAAYRQVGLYAGRILKGENPADLPVMQPTKFELVINLKAANALDLDVPPTLLARADEVIE
jgi:putative ABC transport system substrate-binding protein